MTDHITGMSERASRLPTEFVQAIDDAAGLLDRARSTGHGRPVPASEPLPGLLEQCRQLVAEAAAMEPEPIRTVHHFACTGGTLIAKCVAVMPNTQLLSEVDPLSEMGHSQRGEFLPTDLLGLVRSGTRDVDDALLVDIFLRGLSAVYEDARDKGIRLILRDHAHSQFCVGPAIKGRPTLYEMVAKDYLVRAILTVRHPIDSYLSLLNNDWLHFDPKTVDEYARRYLAFLDRYRHCEIFRYEDFVAEPEGCMRNICRELVLPFNETFVDTFSIQRLSGDSGREGTIISQRPRRSVSEELRAELDLSESMKILCERLGYSSDVADENDVKL